MKKFDLIYYCDGYPEIGMGHVFRGIDIVNSFVKENPDSVVAIQGKYHDQSINFIRKQLLSNIEILSFNEEAKSIVSVIDTMFYPGELRINNEYFSRVKKKSSTLIFLWDVMEYTIPKEVDIAINHLPYSKIYGDTKFEKYLGLEYTPVPRKFYENNSYKKNTGSILSIIGSSNMPNVVEPFLSYLVNLDTELEKIIILSPSYNKAVLSEFKQNFNNITFKQNVFKIENYIKEASVVVTTYGNTTFQAMASKVPTFTVAFQDFQNLYGGKLESAGYSVNLGMFENLQIEKLSLITNDDFKVKMHKKLKEKFVNPGIDEIIRVISENLTKDRTN